MTPLNEAVEVTSRGLECICVSPPHDHRRQFCAQPRWAIGNRRTRYYLATAQAGRHCFTPTAKVSIRPSQIIGAMTNQ